MTVIRRLNSEGISEFRAWLASGGHGSPPVDLLSDASTSEPLGETCSVENVLFANRFEFGSYLVDKLAPVASATLRFDVGVWDWLSIYYFDQLCPPKSDGTRKLQEHVKYSLELAGRKWSRHLVRMSWMSVSEHGENARVMLSVPMSTHPEILEQLAGAQETFGSKTVVALARALYWDSAAGKTKRGAQGKGQGSPRRLSKLMRQFRRTWDPVAMTPEQLAGLLPKQEFGRWVQ